MERKKETMKKSLISVGVLVVISLSNLSDLLSFCTRGLTSFPELPGPSIILNGLG